MRNLLRLQGWLIERFQSGLRQAGRHRLAIPRGGHWGRSAAAIPPVPSLPPPFAAAAERLQCKRYKPLGTTGFDVVGSWGWLRVEVPEAS